MTTTTATANAPQLQHLVFPGQVLAVSSSDNNSNSDQDDSFLRGHGTYIQAVGSQRRLVASCLGTVQRVNKLISVQPCSSSLYQAHTGDLVVGRIAAVGASRWNVVLNPTARTAALPLSGVHLAGGVQRVRTAQDAREMRHFLSEGDLVSAEVHKVQAADGTVYLHTRSHRYGKLENGCLVTVPPALVPRRKNHLVTLVVDGDDNSKYQFEVLFGCNGMIWMQRKLDASTSTAATADGQQELAQLQEQRRAEHAAMPYTVHERRALARLRNCIECLRLTQCMVTAESVQQVYQASCRLLPTASSLLSHMLLPHNVIRLTASQRP